MYKLVNCIEKIDRHRQDLVTLSKIVKSQCLRNIKKFSFPHRTVDIWNGLSEEIVAAESVHKFKEKLDKCRYGGRTHTHTHTHTQTW
ncbi:hypothetical protein E2C01_080352 [Portunus trituberculatus]|uniref:Uncharacterized protein n=1 Tax=Portunus trituberculatus TaxID=210409 RepID=A0A5B7IJH4_PORTR|nr:hypothetical protein [Portunus trituberculatus]